MPRMMEYFAASGANPPLEACLAKIQAQGPSHRPTCWWSSWHIVTAGCLQTSQGRSGKSITWLECEEGQGESARKSWLSWWIRTTPGRTNFVKAYRVSQAIGIARHARVVRRSPRQHGAVGPVQVVARFPRHPGHVSRRPIVARRDRGRIVRLAGPAPGVPANAAELAEPTGDPTAYLEALHAQTSHIDIRGLIVGSGRPLG